jgi:hypothetical protein
MICGLYHPPKPRYEECELIDYLTDLTDCFLDSNPNGTVLIGGDLNRLNLELLTTLTGLVSLVDFATRGNSILDNCLTNNAQLFSKCYPLTAQIKSDHKGVVLPAGIKLKPLRLKSFVRDCREQHKIEFDNKLSNMDWSFLRDFSNINDIVGAFQSEIIKLMDECFPKRSVTLSSRDPPWMTPLVKRLLKKRAKLKNKGSTNRLADIASRINQLIVENRRNLVSGCSVGSAKWWKRVDTLSCRKEGATTQVNQQFAEELNEYF